MQSFINFKIMYKLKKHALLKLKAKICQEYKTS